MTHTFCPRCGGAVRHSLAGLIDVPGGDKHVCRKPEPKKKKAKGKK